MCHDLRTFIFVRLGTTDKLSGSLRGVSVIVKLVKLGTGDKSIDVICVLLRVKLVKLGTGDKSIDVSLLLDKSNDLRVGCSPSNRT
jgi:hypothetical protein